MSTVSEMASEYASRFKGNIQAFECACRLFEWHSTCVSTGGPSHRPTPRVNHLVCLDLGRRVYLVSYMFFVLDQLQDWPI